jgi:hypothetical protein
MLDRIKNLFASMAALLLVGVVWICIGVGTLILSPIMFITRRLFNWPRSK